MRSVCSSMPPSVYRFCFKQKEIARSKLKMQPKCGVATLQPYQRLDQIFNFLQKSAYINIYKQSTCYYLCLERDVLSLSLLPPTTYPCPRYVFLCAVMILDIWRWTDYLYMYEYIDRYCTYMVYTRYFLFQQGDPFYVPNLVVSFFDICKKHNI